MADDPCATAAPDLSPEWQESHMTWPERVLAGLAVALGLLAYGEIVAAVIR